MKRKILTFSTIAVLAVIAIGATYAYFSSSVTIEGISITSGNADLKILVEYNGTYTDDPTTISQYAQAMLTNLYPGQSGEQDFFLKNTSSSPISLDTYFKLEKTNGDDTLADAIELKLKRMDGYESGWHSISWWADNSPGKGWRMMENPGEPEVIAQNEMHGWTLYGRVRADAGNEIENQALGLSATINAEQSLPTSPGGEGGENGEEGATTTYYHTGGESPTDTEYCYSSDGSLQYKCMICKYIGDGDCENENLGICTNYLDGTDCGVGQICQDGSCVSAGP